MVVHKCGDNVNSPSARNPSADLISLLRDLVALPSVNPSDGPPDGELYGEARVVDYLEGFFRACRVPCARQEALPGRENLVAWLEGRGGKPLILEAHTDTVSVEGVQNAPFDPVLKGGRVYGRGSCDCKASLAAMAWALVQVALRGVPERHLVFAATCDEEYKFSGIRRFLADPQVAGLTPQDLPGAAACVGEPTRLELVIAHKGAFRWRVRTRGRAVHSSRPWEGDNAILRMAPLLERMAAYGEALRARPGHPLVGGPSFSVGVIRGGSAVNIVPDLCEVLVDRRLIPGEDGEAAEAELRGFLGDSGYELVTLLEDWPLETPPEAEVVSRAEEALRAALGQATVTGVSYGTDASKMARNGVESVVCGPGDIAQAHTSEEWVEVEQVEAAARVYGHFLDF